MTVLTVTMIAGFLVLIAVFVIRFSAAGPDFPDQITLPDGVHAQAFTQAASWYAIVTDDDTILIFDRNSNALRQTIELK